MKLFRVSIFLEQKSWEGLRGCPSEPYDIRKIALNRTKIIFISHRWEEPDHPDRRGRQLVQSQKILSRAIHIGPDDLVFYDFVSLHQKPRTPQQEKEFRRDLRFGLPDLMANVHTSTLVIMSPDYYQRGWCMFEYLLSKRILNADIRPHARMQQLMRGAFASNPANPERSYQRHLDDYIAFGQAQVEKLQFTNGADRATVRDLVRLSIIELALNVEHRHL